MSSGNYLLTAITNPIGEYRAASNVQYVPDLEQMENFLYIHEQLFMFSAGQDNDVNTIILHNLAVTLDELRWTAPPDELASIKNILLDTLKVFNMPTDLTNEDFGPMFLNIPLVSETRH